MGRNDMKLRIGGVAASAIAAALIWAVPAAAQEKLTVWWVKGFYKSEDDALFEAIRKFEAKTGVKIELSQYAVQDMIPKTVAALDSGTPPDVAYADTYDFQVGGKWAYEGRLEDLSDILTPLKDRFSDNTLSTAFLWNNKEKKRAYYSFPLKQQTMHIQYWKDMVAQAGFKEADIPKDWKGYWDFWCDKAQPGYRKATSQRVFGVGQPLGVDSTDSFYSILTFIDAYGVKMVDDNGKLTLDDAAKKGLAGAIGDYAAIYTRSCTPPSSTSWKDPDNNVAFHNKTTVLTHNATISIAAKWLDDANNPANSDEVRAQAKKNYDENIATAGFPDRPDGKPMAYRAAVKTGLVFNNAANKKRGKEFVAFLLDEENLRPYVEGSLGRWFPVTKAGAESPFWQADPHRRAVYNQFKAGTSNFEFTRNWKFTILNNENVWAKAANRIINDKLSAEKAVDELVARITEVAASMD
jgi:multiple sugar transport system substrate-binding protein